MVVPAVDAVGLPCFLAGALAACFLGGILEAPEHHFVYGTLLTKFS